MDTIKVKIEPDPPEGSGCVMFFVCMLLAIPLTLWGFWPGLIVDLVGVVTISVIWAINSPEEKEKASTTGKEGLAQEED